MKSKKYVDFGCKSRKLVVQLEDKYNKSGDLQKQHSIFNAITRDIIWEEVREAGCRIHDVVMLKSKNFSYL